MSNACSFNGTTKATNLVGLSQLNAEIRPICHPLALLQTHNISHVSALRVNELANGHTASVFGRFLTLAYTADPSADHALPSVWSHCTRVVTLHTCGHTAHARRPTSRQFLKGLRVECIKMGEQLLLENSLLKLLLLEDEESDWVNPIFDEREKCGEFHTLFPMLLEQAQRFFFFSILERGPTHSGTSYIILGHIQKNKVILGNVFPTKVFLLRPCFGSSCSVHPTVVYVHTPKK